MRQGVTTLEKRPQGMMTSFYVDAVPSVFKSSFGSLFDTEVYQLKISEETDTHALESVIVFNYEIQ